MQYNAKEIEKKWQKRWEESNAFTVKEDLNKPKYYVLEMFPYPSGRVHMGHIRNYSIGDVIARYKLAEGFNVLHPMGWDAFGLPAENAAIENKSHPNTWTNQNIAAMKKQLAPLGFSYDWGREINSSDVSYYKHEQEIFLDFFANGLAYQKESIVNWDPVDETVLANEQVENGRGWRSGAVVERKKLKQWFLKITDFVEELIDDLSSLTEWPEKVVTMQRNWIGKSEGAEISFETTFNHQLVAYSTTPEAIFGATFIAIAYDHPLVALLESKEIQIFIQECAHGAVSAESIETAEKKGVFTGHFAKHPLLEGQSIPIYIANFVLMDYGTGAIFGCPAHDERDHEFASKYKLPIVQIIEPSIEHDFTKSAYCGDGTMIASQFLNGMKVINARAAIIEKMEALGVGKRKIQYRLRDWGVSRQRYWGCPIPVIHCVDCGVVPVPKEHLPVTLPEDVKFEGRGNPLDHHPTWKHVACPKCGSKALRETDTFDTFFESSWYFARFCAPQANVPLQKEAMDYWLPVDQYIGGIEHAVLHLLYARFFTKALTKIGYLNLQEPFAKLLTQGMICHETYKDSEGKWLYPEEVKKEGKELYKIADGSLVSIGRSEKMSKSKKNVVDPAIILEKYGADTARLFSLSDSPPERDLEWTDAGVEGCNKFLGRVFKLVTSSLNAFVEADNEELKYVHKVIYDVSNLYNDMHFNKAIARIRELVNYLSERGKFSRFSIEILLQLLNPIVPHLAEDLWQRLGNKTMLVAHKWPAYRDEFLVEEKVNLAIQLNGKMKGVVAVKADASEGEVMEVIHALPNIKAQLSGKELKRVVYVPQKIINIIY